MNTLFPGYYPFNYQQIKNFIDNSTIVFGASVILDLYRISHWKEFLDIIDAEIDSDRIWLPYDTAWYYHMKLSSVINNQIEEIKTTSKFLNDFKQKIDNPYGHPYFCAEIMSEYRSFIENAQKCLDEDSNSLFSNLKDSEIKTRIKQMFHEKVGEPYDQTKLAQLYSESEERNRIQRPPCLTISLDRDDRIKHNKYVIWKQMQSFAKSSNRPVLLVLNRITPNWFYIYKDSVIQPNQELINEFVEQTNQNFYIITAHDFIDHLVKNKNEIVQELLSQLHDQPTLGNIQQIGTDNNYITK